jgi:hypothetical protein
LISCGLAKLQSTLMAPAGRGFRRSFGRKLTAGRPIAVGPVLRERDWDPAGAVFNQHLTIPQQIQTLGHLILPCSPGALVGLQ